MRLMKDTRQPSHFLQNLCITIIGLLANKKLVKCKKHTWSNPIRNLYKVLILKVTDHEDQDSNRQTLSKRINKALITVIHLKVGSEMKKDWAIKVIHSGTKMLAVEIWRTNSDPSGVWYLLGKTKRKLKLRLPAQHKHLFSMVEETGQTRQTPKMIQ